MMNKAAHVPGFWKTVFFVAAKDIRLEWRGRARVNATMFFALLTLLLFSFAMGPDQALLRRTAPGFLWLALFLASVLSLGESMRIESENQAVEGLRLLPVDSKALFLGKAIVNAGFLGALGVFLVPMLVAVFDAHIKLGVPVLVGVVFLGAAAISAPGTLYAGIAVQARATDVLLPLLLFPVLVPGLLAAVKATGLVFFGDPMGQLGSWLGLLGAFVIIYWSVATVLFGRVIEP